MKLTRQVIRVMLKIEELLVCMYLWIEKYYEFW